MTNRIRISIGESLLANGGIDFVRMAVVLRGGDVTIIDTWLEELQREKSAFVTLTCGARVFEVEIVE